MKPKGKFNFDSKVIRTILIVICVVLTFIMYMQRRTRNYYKQAAKLPFYNVQPADVEDGTYRGKIYTNFLQLESYFTIVLLIYTNFLHVQLDVTVTDHKLTKIKIIENEGAYGKKVAPILDEMIAQNSSVVQAVQGEELASIVFVACVDDALRKGVPGYEADE